MRDRLIELVSKAREKCNLTNCCDCEYRDAEPLTNCYSYLIADQLLESGVIVPPCKVGTRVYRLVPDFSVIFPDPPEKKIICASFTLSMINNFGKTVFLTREEAEQALKGEQT